MKWWLWDMTKKVSFKFHSRKTDIILHLSMKELFVGARFFFSSLEPSVSAHEFWVLHLVKRGSLFWKTSLMCSDIQNKMRYTARPKTKSSGLDEASKTCVIENSQMKWNKWSQMNFEVCGIWTSLLVRNSESAVWSWGRHPESLPRTKKSQFCSVTSSVLGT